VGGHGKRLIVAPQILGAVNGGKWARVHISSVGAADRKVDPAPLTSGVPRPDFPDAAQRCNCFSVCRMICSISSPDFLITSLAAPPTMSAIAIEFMREMTTLPVLV
jgi:hypothetical protein